MTKLCFYPSPTSYAHDPRSTLRFCVTDFSTFSQAISCRNSLRPTRSRRSRYCPVASSSSSRLRAPRTRPSCGSAVDPNTSSSSSRSSPRLLPLPVPLPPPTPTPGKGSRRTATARRSRRTCRRTSGTTRRPRSLPSPPPDDSRRRRTCTTTIFTTLPPDEDR